MKNLLLITMLFSTVLMAQDEVDKNSKYQLSISYGPQFNNFVNYDRDIVTRDGYILPVEGFPGEDALLQKRKIGSYFNATFSLRIGGRNYLEIGHSRTLNQGVYNGVVIFPNGTRVELRDFELRHKNHFYNIGYKRVFDNFSLNGGLGYLAVQQSEINIFPSAGTVLIKERNLDNSNLEEAVVYLGIDYDLYRSGNFTLGVRSTAYFIISYGPDLETFTVSPSLRFDF